MRQIGLHCIGILAVTSALAACATKTTTSTASSTPTELRTQPPRAVQPQPTAAASEASTEPTSEDEAAESSEPQEQPTVDTEEQEPTVASAAPSRPPSELLTSKGVVYVLDYNSSTLKEKVREECTKTTAGDAEKLAACMQKEREAFKADVLRFRRSGTGKLRWVVYKRRGNDLTEVYTTGFTFDDESPGNVRVSPRGGAQGRRPLFKTKPSILVNVPNTYEIVIEDPQYGRLPYSARYGLIGE